MNRWIAILAAVVAVGVGGWFALNTGGNGQTPPDLLGAANAQQNAEDIDTSSIVEMAIGNAEAPVTVIEYASYTCPHCARFHADVYPRLKADYIDTGKINFVYREVYFDRFGLWASAIARCAGPEKFFGISDLIYKGQSEWSRAGGGDPAAIVGELRKLGRLAGLEGDQIEACLQDGDKLRTLVAWFKKNADADGIESTPSFVINGQKYSNMGYTELQKVLDEAAEG